MKRIESIDAFRGFDMMWIMGFSYIIVAICNLFPEGGNSFIVSQMKHVAWNGLSFMDLIFPTFLFIAGMSFPFSFAKQQEKGLSRGKIHLRILRRAFLLVLLGLVYNGLLLNYNLSELRWCSVLGRIGLAWMFAAFIFVNCSKKSTRAAICFLLLLGYYVIMRFCPVPGAPQGANPFSMEWNIAGYIDSLIVPGRMYYGNFDPEGLLGLIPATATAMLGMFAGEFIKDSKLPGGKKSLYMLAAAAALLALGLLWSLLFPVNKKLWSSSFVCVVAAYSLACFTLFYYIIDVKGHKKWAFPFKVIGMNSITIYMIGCFVNFDFTSRALLGGLCSLAGERFAPLILETGSFLLSWLLLYFLYKKKIFLKV